MTEFLEGDPMIGDFEAQLFHYQNLEGVVMEEVEHIIIGPFFLETSNY